VVKWFDMDKRRLLNRDTCRVLSALTSTDRRGVHFFDQTWLKKDADIVGGKRSNIK
jgi:hypothetical protein